MRIADITNRLNSMVQSEDFKARLKKIHKYSDCHALVKEVIAPVVKQYKLFTAYLWRIRKGDIEIITYSMNFIPYKNSKTWRLRGYFTDVIFTPREELTNMTLQEAQSFMDAKKITDDITYWQKEIFRLQEELQQAQEKLAAARAGLVERKTSRKEVKTNG